MKNIHAQIPRQLLMDGHAPPVVTHADVGGPPDGAVHTADVGSLKMKFDRN